MTLKRGLGDADRTVSAYCDNLLTLYKALWLFAGIDEVEPTNTHAI